MDDVTFVVWDEGSLEQVLKYTGDYGEVAGTCIKEENSIHLMVGNWGSLQDYWLQMEQKGLKVLGVYMDVAGKGRVAWEVLNRVGEASVRVMGIIV